MTMDNLTEQEIKDLIVEFNLDETINDLKRYYSTPTTWEIINQSRKETSHTRFLAWFFGNKDFNADPNMGPVKKLIVLLLKWANKQDVANFDEELANSIYSQSFSILSCPKVKAEYPIFIQQTSEGKPAYGDGSIDIFITCRANVNDVERNINIVIENKIASPETTKCFDKDGKKIDKHNARGTKTILYQTEAYYQYVTEKYKNGINLFVFLKPTIKLENIERAECKCGKYIQINYQELLDCILQPVCEQKGITSEDRFRLKDYIKALGKPFETDNDKENDSNKHIIIMAMDQKERELLNDFFKNNENLIRAAIDALGNEELSKKMADEPRKSHPRNSYSINQKGNYSMYEVLEAFVRFRLDNYPVSVRDIDDEIKGFLNSNRVNLSDTRDIEVCQEGKKLHGTCTFKSRDGQEIRYTKQWGDGNTNTTFTRFRERVNDNYPGFQIDVI